MPKNINRFSNLLSTQVRRKKTKMFVSGLKRIPRIKVAAYNGSKFRASHFDKLSLRNPMVFQQKEIDKLFFHYGILKSCSFPFLTKFGPKLLEVLERYNMAGLAYFVIKNTFYKHFVAGKDIDESLKVIESLGKQGISSIMDYSVEHIEYDTEEVVNTLIETIKLARLNENTEFSCFKMTALTSSTVLRKVNEVIESRYLHGRQIDWEKLKTSENVYDFVNDLFIEDLTREELHDVNVLLSRLIRIGESAVEVNSSVLIDAEQSFYQQAIHFFVQILYILYNRSRPVFYGTYQMYLKSAYKCLEQDIKLSKIHNFYLGAKIVRGAYMDSERERAKKLNIEDPIHETMENTHESYNNAIRLLLKEIKRNSKTSIMIATHNEESIVLASQIMSTLNIKPKSKSVYFAQLYGLCDHITLALSQKGFNSCKYVPFGPVKSVIPYLIRRMMENKDVIGKTKEERELIMAEIVRRFLK